MVDLQAAFVGRNALRCGFCTPGTLLTAAVDLAKGGTPDRIAVQEHLPGNYCRCTGYRSIMHAVEEVASARSGDARSASR